MDFQMTKHIDPPIGDFSNDIAALRDDVEKLAASVGSMIQHQATSAGSRVADVVSDVGHRISDKAADARTQVKAVSAKVEAGIEHNPLMAVLIAFGVGMSIALLTRSRG
jgi:ElaB/YqjD/DUF883 family membrane-anchored ribosome-binding protein